MKPIKLLQNFGLMYPLKEIYFGKLSLAFFT